MYGDQHFSFFRQIDVYPRAMWVNSCSSLKQISTETLLCQLTVFMGISDEKNYEKQTPSREKIVANRSVNPTIKIF